MPDKTTNPDPDDTKQQAFDPDAAPDQDATVTYNPMQHADENEPTETLDGSAVTPDQQADSSTLLAGLEGNREHILMRGEFGDYELLNEIGRGGMGVVYRAQHKKLGRMVALKMIIGGRMASKEDLMRFLAEAKSAARLQHQHIVTVHEIGEVDGQFYFSMELVEGDTLANRLAAGPLPGKIAAYYIQMVALALHYAHGQGILHRDLKPSNIMIDAKDFPKVTDFGLAKRLDEEATHHTQTGAVLGTPSYMSPEQAAGKINEITSACDVYGLGAVLYELLTGRPPFRSDTHFDTIMHVMYSDPVPPRLLNPKVDVDLETICLKCLEKTPSNRYASAEDLANDLTRYLNGESIKARGFNVIDRLGRALDRSHHTSAFHTWSSMLFLIAAIVFFEHVAVFILAQLDLPSYWFIIARSSQFVLLGMVFWWNRGDQLLPRTAAERELWTIWIGYIVAYGAAYLLVQYFTQNGIISAGPNAPPHWNNLILYPISSVLSGLAFFFMGCNYWGRCYAIGLAFMLLAIISTWYLAWAPLVFGLLWGIAVTSLGFHLRHLSHKTAEEQTRLASQSSLAETQLYQAQNQ